jgi:hypothetical protein
LYEEFIFRIFMGIVDNDSSPIQKASELRQAIAKDTGTSEHVRLPQPAQEALEQFPIAVNERNPA